MRGPLEGIRILDFTQAYSGPHCTMILADLGAEVIKVERPPAGDMNRYWQPVVGKQSGYYASVNRNKKGISVDLGTEEGKEVIRKLIPTVDVVMENFKVGVMDRLGFSFENQKALNPKIVYANISGFGTTTSLASRPSFDVICEGMSGLMSVTGTEEGGPLRAGPSFADAIAGTYCTTGILIALRARDLTGEAQRVDISMLDTVFASLENRALEYTIAGRIPKRMGNRDMSAAPFEVYPAADGDIVIACGHDGQFARLAKLMGRPELIEDPRFATNHKRILHRDELEEEIVAWTKKHTQEEIEKLLVDAKVPCAIICTDLAELMSRDYIHNGKLLWKVYQPEMDMEISFPGMPIYFKNHDFGVYRPAANQMGKDNYEVLHELTGMSEEEVRALEAEGVLYRQEL